MQEKSYTWKSEDGNREGYNFNFFRKGIRIAQDSPLLQIGLYEWNHLCAHIYSSIGIMVLLLI